MRLVKINETQLAAIKALGIQFEEVAEEPEDIVYARHKDLGFIVKFFNETTGAVVVGSNGWKVDDYADDFISYKKSQWKILTKSEVEELLNPTKAAPTYTYPLYMRFTSSNLIVKFDGLNSGTVIRDVIGWPIGTKSDNWIRHTDTNQWTPIEYNEKLGIFDKQLCECWDDYMTHFRTYRFYSVEKGGMYTSDGTITNGSKYHNMKPVPFDQYPAWALEAEKTLEG
jgi:hypothetical protein